MKSVTALFCMIRPGNGIMAAVAVSVAWFYASPSKDVLDLFLRIISTVCALGFGNVLNDILDVKTDAVAHPDRPLVREIVSVRQAVVFALVLAVLALVVSFYQSILLGCAVLIPLILLTVYAFFLKGTPLAGNILVAILVAYTLIFGALGGNVTPLILPALLAALSNFSREILKDLVDKEGDVSVGLRTSAVLPLSVLKTILYSNALIYCVLAPVPFITQSMGVSYLVVLLVAVYPLHFFWIRLLTKSPQKSAQILKLQMLAGLAAIVLDKFL